MNDQSNTNVANRSAVLRPDVVSRDFYRGQSRAQYFNLAAFAPTPAGAGRFGNAGVGILQGPGTAAVSLGVAKSYARDGEGTGAVRDYVYECAEPYEPGSAGYGGG